MYRRIQDFLGSWAYETETMLKVLDAMTDESLEQQVHCEGRTLGRIAWHIVQTLPEMGGRTGLRIPGPGEEDPIPDTTQEIAARFKEAADSVAEQIQGSWSDDDLEVEDDMYGERWMRGRSLRVLVGHQTHHRGQMTVLMRQAGLTVPGVYGPAKEEWDQYGMPPQE